MPKLHTSLPVEYFLKFNACNWELCQNTHTHSQVTKVHVLSIVVTLPQEGSTESESCPHEKYNSHHSLNLLPFQSHQSITQTALIIMSNIMNRTLHVPSLATRTLRAAKSRWTNIFLSRYSIPLAMSLQKPSSLPSVSPGRTSPGVLCAHSGVCVYMRTAEKELSGRAGLLLIPYRGLRLRRWFLRSP